LDQKLSILSVFWLVKVGITLFLLYAGWIPDLFDTSALSWGYDPQRYFHDSYDLIENGWTSVASLNYQGIIYYYAGIFYLFGYNPVIPAIINAFVTLLGTLFLIFCAYKFSQNHTRKDWTIAWLLLVPEVLWYDVMTSRETLMAVLIIFATLSVGSYLAGIKKHGIANTLLLSGISIFGILAVRTSMVAPVIASILIMIFVLSEYNKISFIKKNILLAIGIGVLFFAPLMQTILGGYDMSYYDQISRIQSYSEFESNYEWSNQSIGLLFAPKNLLQSVIYIPPRMYLYLMAPLPNVSSLSINGLIQGRWADWQLLMTLPNSVIILLGFPYTLASTEQAWRNRIHQPISLIIPITFWITFIAVVGGNVIIHERYRSMFTLLLFVSMWLGYTRCKYWEVKRWAWLWYALLGLSSVFYIVYKFIL
jgi:hypothetical protein